MRPVSNSSKEKPASSNTSYYNEQIAKSVSKQSQTVLQKIVSQLDNEDATARYQLEADDHQIEPPGSSTNQNDGLERHIVSWAPHDPDNPHNWSSARKLYISFVGLLTVLNSTLGSTITSESVDYLSTYFNIADSNLLILPVSIYLVGYILGPLLFGPVSEQVGRKLVTILTFAGYTIFMIVSAVAPTFPVLLVFRFLCGVFASSPITVNVGSYADIYPDAPKRGKAMAIYLVLMSESLDAGELRRVMVAV